MTTNIDLINKLNIKPVDCVLAFGNNENIDPQFINVEFNQPMLTFLSKQKSKFDKISLLYEEKNGLIEDVVEELLSLCGKRALLLISKVPVVDRIRSNGTIKLNKETILNFIKNKIQITQFWFLNETEENFELLAEVINSDRQTRRHF